MIDRLTEAVIGRPVPLRFETSRGVFCVRVNWLCFVASVESSSPSLLAPDNTLERSFFIRMKSTLTKRGVHIKSSGYKVSHALSTETTVAIL